MSKVFVTRHWIDDTVEVIEVKDKEYTAKYDSSSDKEEEKDSDK